MRNPLDNCPYPAVHDDVQDVLVIYQAILRQSNGLTRLEYQDLCQDLIQYFQRAEAAGMVPEGTGYQYLQYVATVWSSVILP
jgi:hypothetical protein